jgi:hypothetical protein
MLATDLSACLGGSLIVHMANHLIVKYVEWNSRIVTIRCKHLRDYADKHSCLNYRQNTPTTVTYNSLSSQCLRHRYHEGSGKPSASDDVLQHSMSIVLSLPTRTPRPKED